MNLINLHTIPSGAQVVVAIMTLYTGYNQEDSILFNKGSIESRGLFQATIYHTEKDEDNVERDHLLATSNAKSLFLICPVSLSIFNGVYIT